MIESIRIAAGKEELDGDLAIPDQDVRGLVLFAHGSGSSRFSSRNRFVAEQLRVAGLATLLMDLLTPIEEKREELGGYLRFDIGLLAARLIAAMEHLGVDPRTMKLPMGLFGPGT